MVGDAMTLVHSRASQTSDVGSIPIARSISSKTDGLSSIDVIRDLITGEIKGNGLPFCPFVTNEFHGFHQTQDIEFGRVEFVRNGGDFSRYFCHVRREL
jgi:hypothetical protein